MKSLSLKLLAILWNRLNEKVIKVIWNYQSNLLKSFGNRAISGQKLTALVLALSIGVIFNPAISFAQINEPLIQPVRGQVSISREVEVSSSEEKVALNIRNASLKDVLNMLAEQGKFNIIMDDSVIGTLTVDIKNISVNKALEYIFTVMGLSYTKDGNTIIVASAANADQKNLNAKTFKAIPVRYKNASILAEQLNETIFKVSRPGGSSTAVAAADTDSNSLLVMGTDEDIHLVNKALTELDIPRNRKVYQIKHSTPMYVSQVLAANFFTNLNLQNANGAGAGVGAGAGGAGLGAGVGAGGAGAGLGAGAGGAGLGAGGVGVGAGVGAGGAGAGVGAGAGGAGVGAGAGAGAGGAGVGASLVQFSAGGVTFIAEPIAATLTVLGTNEQIALIDSIIEDVDVKRPQAVVEVSLVEVQTSELKAFQPLWGAFNLGKEASLNLNVLDGVGNPTGRNIFSYSSTNIQNIAQGGFLSSFSLSQSHQSIRGKILANPTIVALDGMTSSIAITDQIANVQQTTTTTTTGNIITNVITTQDAGITLAITPNITNDGSIILQLSPEVSQPTRTISAGSTSTTLISKRSMNLSGVRVKDGETLVIGGLISETDTSDISHIPGLDKLPIVSAMFRSINSKNKNKTELVLMVTPHILQEDAVTYFKAPARQQASQGKTLGLKAQDNGVPAPVAFPLMLDESSPNGSSPAQQKSLYRSSHEKSLKRDTGKPKKTEQDAGKAKTGSTLTDLPLKAEIMKD